MTRAVLIANRGEVAVRVARACAALGLRAVAVYSRDDAGSLHVRRADAAVALPGVGAAAYLDIPGLVAAAREAGCWAVHPGYGFLSEDPGFAAACAEAGLAFVGPSPDVLRLFGDKTRARRLAAECGVAVPRGSDGPVELAEATAFLQSLGPGGSVMVKAVTGGGGRGMRAADSTAGLAEAWARCLSEARTATGRADLYVEELISRARHIEIQVIGDSQGGVSQLGERDCTVQRRHQKLIEVAPGPGLPPAVRDGMARAAVRMAGRASLAGLCTFEFLLDTADGARFVFIEANPRLQVEHTVTEEVLGVDLVAAQLRVAAGATLAEIGLDQPSVPAPRGVAIQARVNMEAMQPDGGALPTGGTLRAYEPPSGSGVRVDGFGTAGYRTSSAFDSLLAKVVVHQAGFAEAAALACRALREFRIEGVGTNVGFLRAVLAHPDFLAHQVTTRWLDTEAAALAAEAQDTTDAPNPEDGPAPDPAAGEDAAPPGTVAVAAPMQGMVVALDVAAGDPIQMGGQIGVLEAMKMEHVVTAPAAGQVHAVAAQVGQVLLPGQALAFILPGGEDAAQTLADAAPDLDAVRPDLQALQDRLTLTLDAARPAAVAKRHAAGGRTARENVADLVDPGSFVEYGGLAVAAQRSRRPMEELLRTTPADGVVCGVGTVNAALVGEERAAAVVVAYDYTVLAGTQGTMNHKKQDRVFSLAASLRRPVVLLAEGGGGRPGDTDKELLTAGSLDVPTFGAFARLSGLVPLVGVVHGRCFAGNAALLGCSDVIIATRSANIGMGGPAMIEGGGLGVFTPEQVGPAGVQWPNGVIDVLVDDEAAAVAAARQYLSYFQGALPDGDCADQRVLRGLVPENRLRSYDVRRVIGALADTGSVLELRGGFGAGMVTALVRVAGRPMGLIANNPRHLGGAIDADAADKAARFLGLCDAHGLPVLSLCDTPGFMVGPDAERTAQVRRVCRMFVAGANLRVPFFTVVLRKGYGLGAMAMAAGCFSSPLFNVSWPTGEFGGMGLEGAVRLGARRELAAIADPAAREAEFQRRLEAMYARGRATSAASVLEIDAVIDPADTRSWIIRGLRAAPPPAAGAGKTRPFVDTW